MTVVHVEFPTWNLDQDDRDDVSRFIRDEPLNYRIDWRTGERSECYATAQAAWSAVSTLWDQLYWSLTFNQYKRATTYKGHAVMDYKTRLQRALKVSKKRRVIRLANEALALIDLIERDFPAPSQSALAPNQDVQAPF